jgi:hypothetical protein
MPINFIPNDPLAVSTIPIRKVSPRPDRPASRAGVTIKSDVAEDLYDVGTSDFLFWQCREAVLSALEAWEAITGRSVKLWQADRKTIALIPDAGVDVNAYYNRTNLSFFHASGGGNTYFSGASTDVVAHETGHGILDGIRPEFWDSSLFEVNSFHEAFADCVAILTALNDKETRTAVFALLDKKNAVESTAEELADGVKVIINPNHNAAAPRRARNTLQHATPRPSRSSAAQGTGRAS